MSFFSIPLSLRIAAWGLVDGYLATLFALNIMVLSWLNVNIKHFRWKGQSGTSIGNINNACKSAFERNSTQKEVGLLSGPSELFQVVDGISAGVLVRQRRVQILLFSIRVLFFLAAVIDRDAFEGQITRVPGLQVAAHEERVLGYIILGSL